jgi:hypothetical protein
MTMEVTRLLSFKSPLQKIVSGEGVAVDEVLNLSVTFSTSALYCFQSLKPRLIW